MALLEIVYHFICNIPFNANVILCVLVSVLMLWYWLLHMPQGIPPGPSGFPILGYMPLMGQKPQDTLSKLSKKYGPVFRIYMGSKLTVVLSDYESVSEAFLKQADTFSGRPKNLMFSALPHEKYNIVTSDGAIWKAHRRFALSVLRDCGLGKLEFEQGIMSEIQHFLSEMKKLNGVPTDLSELMGLSVFNNICILLLGKTFSYDDPWVKNAKHVIDQLATESSFMLILQLWPWLRYVPGIYKMLNQESLINAVGKLDQSIQKMCEEIKSQEKVGQWDSYTSAYIDTQKEQRDKKQKSDFFEDAGLQQNVRTLLAAGTETTTTTLMWVIKYMIQYPEVQEKVRKELDAVIGSDRTPSWSDRKRTPYTEATICEIQRIATIVPMNVPHRNFTKCVIKGYNIPKGCDIFVNLWAIHHDPKLWKDPEEFRPERFLSENGEVVKPDYLIPFSTGKRQCLGESLARVEIYLYMTAMLQKFIFKEAEGTKSSLEDRLGFTYSPKYFRPRAILRSAHTL